MNIPLIDLQLQHHTLRQEINEAVQTIFDRADFVLGKDVSMFEEEFANYCGTKYAVGVDSGLSALELSLRAFGVGPGDEVIVPAHTFVATATAVTLCGAKPVFVDIDANTYNIDVTQIESAITTRTKAIIPVHLYGLPADMEAILRIADAHGLVVIEDSCQAHGAEYHGKRTGNLGHAGAFSFYPTKNLGGCGDGGIVTTNDERVAATIRSLRNCGQKVKNVHELLPLNHRLDTLQAAILRIKLRYLDHWIESRRQIAALYSSLLANSPVYLPAESNASKHVYHLYVIRTSFRDALQAYLKDKGIGTAIHYPMPVHLQPFYVGNQDSQQSYPVAERICGEILSLPMYPELTDEQVRVVCSEVSAMLEQVRNK